MDQIAYRFETSHVMKQAVANFGNPAEAEQLYNKFESIVRQVSKNISGIRLVFLVRTFAERDFINRRS